MFICSSLVTPNGPMNAGYMLYTRPNTFIILGEKCRGVLEEACRFSPSPGQECPDQESRRAGASYSSPLVTLINSDDDSAVAESMAVPMGGSEVGTVSLLYMAKQAKYKYMKP